MTNTALATQPTANPALQKFKTVADLLQKDDVKAAIANALPKHMTAERMIRVAMTALQKTPKLAECEPRSLVNALIQASELGLEPNTPLGEAYLIPFWNKNTSKTEAQLMPGYRGLIKLARQSEKVDGIYAEIVYEKDYFEIEYGLNKDLKHRPALNEEDRGKMLGAYAVAKFKDGYTDFEYMNATEIGKIRARSKTPDKGPWQTDTSEMWRKTPIRRLCKRLPQSVEDKALQKAIEIDSFHDIDMGRMAPLELGDGDGTPVISEEQRVALVEAAKVSGADLTSIVQQAGFEMLADITADRYDEILQAVQVETKPGVEIGVGEPPDFNNMKPGDPVTFTTIVEEPKADATQEQAPAPAATALTYQEAFDLVQETIKSMDEAVVKKVLGKRNIDKLDAKQLVILNTELNSAE